MYPRPTGESPTLQIKRDLGLLLLLKNSLMINNLIFYIPHLRPTREGFKRNSLTVAQSPKNYPRRWFSSQAVKLSNNRLNPWFFTGFADGESSFLVGVVEDKKLKTGWRVYLCFSIEVHIKDRTLLEKLKIFLEAGKIYCSHSRETIRWDIKSMKELEIIINHFDKYPLITKKFVDYKKFREAFYIIRSKEHLIKDGLDKIVGLKASMNLGLSDKLIKHFPHIKAVARPNVIYQKIQNPYWLTGFTTAEGSFMVSIAKSNTTIGWAVQLIFQLTQHSRDERLMRSLVEYFNCGEIYKDRCAYNFKVTKISDNVEKIIPFFQEYCIEGIKAKDFEDFCNVAELMVQKKHLTEEGLERIQQIKSNMNRGRKL